jgi:Ca2+-binding EF-hand superfamily protein
LKTALQRQKDKPDANQINNIVTALDTSKSGKITFTEFAAGNIDSALLRNPDMIKLSFDILDHDHDGRISQNDLNTFFLRKSLLM